MADKNQALYTVKLFDMALQIVPNFSALKKSVRDMVTGLSKPAREITAADGLIDSVKAYSESEEEGAFQNALDALRKWTTESISALERTPEDELESKRGRDTSNLKVTLFGNTKLVAEHAGDLLKGSPLAQYLANGLPDSFSGNWPDLNMVLNNVANGVRELIPEDKRPKRPRKGTGDNAEPEPDETNEETPEVEPEAGTEGTNA